MSQERELWRIEHGEEYRPAPFLLALLASGRVQDWSWHNDTCPHFATVEKRDGRTLELFMEAERREDREDPVVPRYSFYRGDDNGVDEIPVFCTDDDAEAEGVFEKFFAGEPLPEGGIRWWEKGHEGGAAPAAPEPAEAKPEAPAYTDALDADRQVTTEERIAAAIFDFEYEEPDERPGEEACAELGRRILRIVLSEFRPDLTGGTDPLRSAVAAVLHQLERGEAAEGDERDIAWCARTLREALGDERPADTALRDAALAGLQELERLRDVLLPEFEGKVGEPSLAVVMQLRAALDFPAPEDDGEEEERPKLPEDWPGALTGNYYRVNLLMGDATGEVEELADGAAAELNEQERAGGSPFRWLPIMRQMPQGFRLAYHVFADGADEWYGEAIVAYRHFERLARETGRARIYYEVEALPLTGEEAEENCIEAVGDFPS